MQAEVEAADFKVRVLLDRVEEELLQAQHQGELMEPLILVGAVEQAMLMLVFLEMVEVA
jgi:hypothetical protein